MVIHRSALQLRVLFGERSAFHNLILMAPKKRATADAVPATTALTTPATKRPKTERGYYLMKSEADVFSIDDLAARMNQTEPWDGVRNHQAKKIIQGMKPGDQAFFWSSNTKFPGITGIVEIVTESYPDATQFDRKSEYYDAKSTKEEPKWSCVDVKLVRKLEMPITLATLKEYSEKELGGMALFKMKRLSVQPVSAEEWEFVLGLEEGC